MRVQTPLDAPALAWFDAHMHSPSDLLSDAEIDRLSNYLASVDTAMNPERFDGFLCALVSGPDPVMLSEYWPVVVGCDPAETEVFSTKKEADEIFGLVIKHWNSIATRLHAGEIYHPLLLEDDDGQVTGIDWAQGFLDGVYLREESWRELIEDEDEDGDAIAPILILAHENHPDPSLRSESLAPEEREQLLQLMCAGLVEISEYFRQRREQPALVSSTPARRSQPKVGRNEPCSCGSGAKYKNCCLRKAH